MKKGQLRELGTDVKFPSGCHNLYRAQRDPLTPAGRFVGQRLPGVVSKPSDHSKDNNAWKLWGADPGQNPPQRMSESALSVGGTYQSPYRYNSTTTYEPDGSTASDGSNLFNTVTFCLDCHQYSLNSARIAALPDSQKPPPAGRTTTNIINWG